MWLALAASLPQALLALSALEAGPPAKEWQGRWQGRWKTQQQHQNQQKASQKFEGASQLLGGEAAGAGEYRFRSEQTSKVELDRCAADFPDFRVYLNRAFGNRSATAEDLTKEPETKYGTGRLGVSLALRDGKVELKMFQVPRGETYKRRALLKVLQGVVDRQQENLRSDLERLGGNVSMYWRFMNGDCPESRLRVGLPLHGYSSDQTRADMAMPDFTFEHYKDIHSKEVNPDWKSEAWGDVSDRLREVPKEKMGFIWRGSLSNAGRQRLSELVNKGPPERLQPLLAEVAPDGFDVTTMKWQDDNGKRSDFMSLYDQCKYAYTFHVPGKHYSAMLKYKLACNQTVFMVRRPAKLKEEFWYEALHHGSEVFYVKEDLSNLWEVIEEAFNATEGRPAGLRAAEVAAGGRRVADTYLSQRGIDCYVMLYLKEFYFPLWAAAMTNNSTSPSSLLLRASSEKHCARPAFGECDCDREGMPEMV